MANGFDFSNIGSIFGGGMGGTPSGLDALLSEDQRKLLGRNAAMSAAAALLQAGGRSTTPINLGQALGSALQAGQQGYQQARAGSLQDILLAEKLKEAQRFGQYQTALAGAPKAEESVQPMAPLTAAQASLLSQTAPTSAAGAFGPTTQRAQLMDQIQAQPTIAPEPLTATEKRYNELMRKADVANQFGKFDDADKLMSQALKIKPPEKYSTTPQFGNSKQGTPISFVLSESGGMKLLDVQRSPEFNYQDTGSYISVRDKNSNRELERIPKTMSPGEVASNVIAQGNLAVNRGNLAVAQGGLNLRQQEFNRGAFDIKESPEGFVYVPKAPGGAAMPVMGAGGSQLVPSKEAPQAFSEAAKKLNNLKGNISAYRTEIESDKTVFPSEVPLPFGAKIPLPTGSDTARLRGKYQSLLMGVKDLYELGALTGPDMGIISEQLTNPASFSGMFTSRNAMKEQIKVLEDMATRAEENLSSTYKRKLPAPSTAGIQPPASAPTAERRMVWRNGRFEFE